VIDGPVLISAGDLTGFERGSNVLNPYRPFQHLKPVTSIQDGVLVYEGRFAVPLASALSHVQQSKALLKQKQFDSALAAAQEAVKIAPDDLEPQIALGDALQALGRKGEANEAYSQAMVEVKTMEPQAQEVWGPRVQKKMMGQ
jgi:tetratricopeptide (TPR) repeat protein